MKRQLSIPSVEQTSTKRIRVDEPDISSVVEPPKSEPADIPILARMLSTVMTEPFSIKNSQNTRHIYESILNEPKENQRPTFLNIAKKAISYLSTDKPNKEEDTVETEKVHISVNGITSLLPKISAIGRANELCDIVLTSMFVSRIHCIVIDYSDSIYFIDIGSLNGFQIKKLDPNGTDIVLHAERGKSLSIKRTESCLLSCGNVSVVINPKKCLVCMSNSRNVVFLPCRHFATCSDCDVFLDKCPICRKQKVGTHLEIARFQTHIPLNRTL